MQTICFLLSCTPQSFVLESAKLYPLYVYNPEEDSLTLFAALSVRLEAGATDIRRIRLEEEGGLFWEIDLVQNGSYISRTPQSSEEEYVSPFFEVGEDDQKTDFLYPWFLSPGENALPNGVYSLILWDYSGENSQISARYTNISENDFQNLKKHLISLNPSQKNIQNSYEVVYLNDPRSNAVLKLEQEEYISSSGDASEGIFLWGVPAGINCLVLAGPY
ncbi:MAG: hypothetical protein ACR2PY_03090 [Salinispira sp.]